MAQENEYISDAAETMFESSQDISIRTFCEGVEEAHRLRRGLELRLERAEAALLEKEEALQANKKALQENKKALQDKDKTIQNNEKALQAKDNEIARLKALLAENQNNR